MTVETHAGGAAGLEALRRMPAMFTTSECALILRAGESAVRSWCSDGTIAADKTLGRWRIPAQAVASLVVKSGGGDAADLSLVASLVCAPVSAGAASAAEVAAAAPALYTSADVARICRFTRRRVDDACAHGLLPCVRVGGSKWLVPAGALLSATGLDGLRPWAASCGIDVGGRRCDGR